jgi:hypothetical protein
VGNRSTDTINNLNQITERDSVSYSYDDVGNLKQDDTQKYYYDYKNRLTKVTDLNDNLITSYKYDIA